MSILFGHPTGNPNSHQAALAYLEAGWLEAFVTPWMPTPKQLNGLSVLPGMRRWLARLDRRCFRPLLGAQRIEGQVGELLRMIQRLLNLRESERLAYQANDWLMHTMKRECNRLGVTAIHGYEDCSLSQFEEAKLRNQSCIYDMPIGFYPAWQKQQHALAKEFTDWVPKEGLSSNRYVRPQQKRREMELADIVLVPSTFVRQTVEQFTDKKIGFAPYGVDLQYWRPSKNAMPNKGPLRFLFVGQCSLRKGLPVLLQAWRAANLGDAELELIGPWKVADSKKREIPPHVQFVGPVSHEELRKHYQTADVFVFPSYFEGFGLVLLEAMACGLPVITTHSSAGRDILDDSVGRVLEAGNIEELVESLRWFARNRERLPAMREFARARAETFTWERYRSKVREAVAPLI